MVEVLFLVRHIPFWGVPLMILGGEFGYMFWLRKKKSTAAFWASLALLGLVSTTFYIWAGGPEKSVKIVKRYYIENRR